MTQNITFSAPSQWTDLSGKRPRNWRATGDTGNRREIRGQVITCAGCGDTVWAASPDGPVLAKWTVEHYPDCCCGPRCRPQPKAAPAPKPPRKRRKMFDVGDRVTVDGKPGVIVDYKRYTTKSRYLVEFVGGLSAYVPAKEMRHVPQGKQVQEVTPANKPIG